MTKIIIIEECNECPFIEYFRKGDNYFCKRVEKRLYKWTLGKIPEWCPLKNEYVPGVCDKEDTMRRRNIGDPR